MRDTLLTDLYQLTMLEAYHARRMTGRASFELYARRLPAQRGFLTVAGLEPALCYLESLRFTVQDLEWLASTNRFSTSFLASLESFRFRGDVWAVPEGTVLPAQAPWLRIEADLPEAQFVESRLINLMHLSTLIATKAARCVLAAQGRPLVDFGMRRAHGAEAAVLAARSAVLAGFSATATVEAGRRYGLPLAGTMAHSYVQSFEDEAEAFRHYARTFNEGTTLLIDTYDTLRAARRVVDLRREGVPVGAVRIDSGDLAGDARTVRGILDEAGAHDIRIVVSGNLDEYEIAALVASAAPIDVFGVGTRLDTSSDAPTLDAVYKLEAYEGRATRKRSPGKETWPGAKQVWRTLDGSGKILEDRLTTLHECVEGAEPLLVPVMRNGERIAAATAFSASIAWAQSSLATVPSRAARLTDPIPWTPVIGKSLRSLVAQMDQRAD